MDTHCVGYKLKKVLYSNLICNINILTMAVWLIYNVTIKDLENSNYYLTYCWCSLFNINTIIFHVILLFSHCCWFCNAQLILHDQLDSIAINTQRWQSNFFILPTLILNVQLCFKLNASILSLCYGLQNGAFGDFGKWEQTYKSNIFPIWPCNGSSDLIISFSCGKDVNDWCIKTVMWCCPYVHIGNTTHP